MSYGEVQISEGGNIWTACVRQDGGYGGQIDCRFENMVGMTDAEADDFFQSFVDHIAVMSGMMIAGAGKDRVATQVITPMA